MNKDEFWKLIEESRESTGSCDDQADYLVDILSKKSEQDVLDYDLHFRERLGESYRWDLWAVAYIINGGCSDDGFEYFRCWLIGKGREYFESALSDAENAAKDVDSEEEVECEPLLYVSMNAYEKLTGVLEIPDTGYRPPSEPQGEEWDEEEVEQLYPALAEKFSYSFSEKEFGD